MNRNTDKKCFINEDFAQVLAALNNPEDVKKFLSEILTDAENLALAKRWEILQMLTNGSSQREIAKTLEVSLCKITRGAKILKNQDGIVSKHFNKK